MKPCRPFPENASYKMIGYTPCSVCKTNDCWLGYLEWEVRSGIDLNRGSHHLVKGSEK